MSTKGFGKITTTTNIKNIEHIKQTRSTSASNIIDNQKLMEEKIQNNIDKLIGLREAMNLSKDLMNIKSSNSMNIMMNIYTEKENRLQELNKSYGWNQETVHNKLQEITWDASAIERNERHQTEKISDPMNDFMTKLAKKCLQLQSDGYMLDVGCGTGVIYSYMKKIHSASKEKGKSRNNNINSGSNNNNNINININNINVNNKSCNFEEKCVGIDLSSEMINIAKKQYPFASFYQSDFMKFTYEQHPFNVIVFNECFHYLVDQKEAIKHAISLCLMKPSSTTSDTPTIATTTTTTTTIADTSPSDSPHSSAATTLTVSSPTSISTIIISHPKGYKHVQKLHSINRLMVPSILPTNNQLEMMIKSIENEFKHDSGCSTESNTNALLRGLRITIETSPIDDSAHYLAILKVSY
jgi:ubiquinone/menaquinone biosynthesis C-methylase UbiE